MTAITTAMRTGNSQIDSLITGARWADPNISYGFSSGSGDYASGYAGNYSLGARPLGGPQQAGFRAALLEWSAVANVHFVETSAANATIRVAVTSSTETAFAYLPSTMQEGGDLWVGTGIASQSPLAGSYAYLVYIHELGHALGFGHPHEGINPGISDQIAYSVMSYRSYPGAPLTGYTIAGDSFPSSPMISDIAAMQVLYGANYSSHSGSDIYRWTPGITVFETIWDGGGTDTYDLSAFSTNLSVDISPGGWISFGSGLANLGNGQRPPGNVATALLFNNDTRSLIENAIGGSGHDLLKGNVGTNDLTGGAGNDSIYGAGGNDVLHGGAGNDVLFGGSGANDPLDGNDIIFGDGGGDLIYGNGGDDQLDAGQGSATVYGGYGVDTISAEITAGSNVFLYGGGASTDPNDLADSIVVRGDGSNGLAQLFGNGGSDTLIVAIGGNARVEVYGGLGDDAVRIVSGNTASSSLIVAGPGADDIILAVGGWNTVYGGSSIIDPMDGSDKIDASSSFGRLEIYGNGGDDTIIGGSNADTIYGGGGNDIIIGGGGADLLYGESGSDTFRIARGDAWSAAPDEIIGFETADKLDLDVAGAGARFSEISSPVSNAAQALNAAADAFAAGALYVAVRAGADTYLFADYDGNRSGEWGVKLTGFSGALDPSLTIV